MTHCVRGGALQNPPMLIFQNVRRALRRPKALFETPSRPFKAGDRVRCTVGAAKGRRGTVVRRPYHFRVTVHAGPDQVWVRFDGDRAAAKTRRVAIEHVEAS